LVVRPEGQKRYQKKVLRRAAGRRGDGGGGSLKTKHLHPSLPHARHGPSNTPLRALRARWRIYRDI
jgi:hypothetical protein